MDVNDRFAALRGCNLTVERKGGHERLLTRDATYASSSPFLRLRLFLSPFYAWRLFVRDHKIVFVILSSAPQFWTYPPVMAVITWHK